MKQNPVIQFIKLSRPVLLLAGIGQTFLGAGIANYLGKAIDWEVFFLGLLWVILTQLATHYLNEYFDEPVDRQNENRTIFSGGSGALGKEEGQLNRRVALSAFVVSVTLSVAVVLTLIWTRSLILTGGLLMVLILLGGIAYSIPPLQLSRSGYGEFIASVIGGYLVPMLSFNLQTGEAHRLVAFSALPITLLLVVFMLAASFPDYATDLKYGKRTFLVRAGWQNAMTIHNTLILLAFVVLASLWFFDFPRGILVPAYLAFPLGISLFWQMRVIRAGGRPSWRALTLNAAGLVGSLIFLLAYTFWTR
jgi:1,4-dihydroxy-2-naphthoate octaprenyltransferase